MADTTAGSPWPEDAEGCDQLGLQWQGEQRYAEAAEAFARGLALAPDDFSLHLHYGNLWSEQCSFAPAEEQYRLALRLDPSSSTARNNLGYVLLKLGRLDEAEVLLREAVALAPELVLTLHNLIQVHRAQRDTRAVLDDAMQILRLCSDDLAARCQLAVALAEEGRTGEAMEGLEETIRLHPQEVWPRNLLGLSQYEVGAVEMAQASFRAALAIDPGDFVVESNLLLMTNYRRADPREVTAQHGAWEERHRLPPGPPAPVWRHERSASATSRPTSAVTRWRSSFCPSWSTMIASASRSISTRPAATATPSRSESASSRRSGARSPN